MKLKFIGHGDDRFVELTTQQEAYVREEGPAAYKLINQGLFQALYVVGIYAAVPCGCWTVGLCLYDEDEAMPPWPMTWYHEGYSVTLEIEVPEGTQVITLTSY